MLFMSCHDMSLYICNDCSICACQCTNQACFTECSYCLVTGASAAGVPTLNLSHHVFFEGSLKLRFKTSMPLPSQSCFKWASTIYQSPA